MTTTCIAYILSHIRYVYEFVCYNMLVYYYIMLNFVFIQYVCNVFT